MRGEKLLHGCETIDRRIVWATIHGAIPDLASWIESVGDDSISYRQYIGLNTNKYGCEASRVAYG